MTCGPLLLNATTVLIGPVFELLADRGILTHAKSRDGSQISATALGRYPPTVAANVFPTFCDVRRIMLAKVGLFGFLSGIAASVMLSSYSSGTSSLARLLLLPRDEGGLPGNEVMLLLLPALGVPSRKIWTVSVAEDTQRSVDVELKDMLYILAGIDPLLN